MSAHLLAEKDIYSLIIFSHKIAAWESFGHFPQNPETNLFHPVVQQNLRPGKYSKRRIHAATQTQGITQLQTLSTLSQCTQIRISHFLKLAICHSVSRSCRRGIVRLIVSPNSNPE